MNQRVAIGGCDGALIAQPGIMSNRHGLIAGATGTGKTVTLQVLAEGFSRLGTPVFVADVKGDLAGICQPGNPHPEVSRRLGLMPADDYRQRAYPTSFLDIYGAQGHPVRTTVSELGPLLLASLLELNETQTGVIYACFAIADDEGLLLLDLKDLRAMLAWLGDNRAALQSRYGNLAAASIGAIQRRLLMLEEQGADHFFGEPALVIGDLMQHDFGGNGVISLLSAGQLLQRSPRLYAAFLLWLLSELFEELPEVGDLPAPRLVLFFDEAHLLFNGMPKALLDKIEQVVRLIRSKGVGVYFVTQSPLDLPQPVLGQLGLKIQHALRAFTPADQKALRSVVAGFRHDESFDVAEALIGMGVGEALVSTLNPDGSPSLVKRTVIRPPESRIGTISAEERAALLARSPLKGKYDTDLDRESAYEMLAARAEAATRGKADEPPGGKPGTTRKAEEGRRREGAGSRRREGAGGRRRESAGEAFLKSAARSVGRSLGSRLVRGILGSLLKSASKSTRASG
jgi:DNA helicase HerA-like ATPase